MVDTRPRLALFVDRQNVYNGARDIFGFNNQFHARGQVDPLRLGRLIAGRVIDNTDRKLAAVHIYRGMPDARKAPKDNAAAMRQVNAWRNLDQKVINVKTRPLRYPFDWPTTKEHEKGIDVQLSIDFVLGYLREDFDVGVLFSGDTDLLPALEAAEEISTQIGALKPEVASWGDRSRSPGRRLRPKGLDLTCHWLGPFDYEQCKDERDFNART